MAKTYYAQNVRIKKTLDDILENAYPNSQKIGKYKGFYFKILDKDVKSYAGQYIPKTKTIEIVGLNRNSKHIVITCIHELAHHVDFCNRGKTDHQKEFYKEYRTLLYAALNMRVFSPEDAEVKDVVDAKKIQKMVEDWRPSFVNYKEDSVVLSVKNCFSLKDVLKKSGYRYNTLSHEWYKEIEKDKEEGERNFLSLIGIAKEDVTESASSSLEIKAKLKIVAKGETYRHKEYLKKNGFRYVDKSWERKVGDKEDVNELVKEYKANLPGCRISFSGT